MMYLEHSEAVTQLSCSACVEAVCAQDHPPVTAEVLHSKHQSIVLIHWERTWLVLQPSALRSCHCWWVWWCLARLLPDALIFFLEVGRHALLVERLVAKDRCPVRAILVHTVQQVLHFLWSVINTRSLTAHWHCWWWSFAAFTPSCHALRHTLVVSGGARLW